MTSIDGLFASASPRAPQSAGGYSDGAGDIDREALAQRVCHMEAELSQLVRAVQHLAASSDMHQQKQQQYMMLMAADGGPRGSSRWADGARGGMVMASAMQMLRLAVTL